MNSYIELLVTLGFLAGLMWAMLRFMLRDIHKDLTDLKEEVHEFKQEMRDYRLATDARFDNLYKTLIDIVNKKN